MESYYPPGGFYFNVHVLGAAGLAMAAANVDASFQEVTGIQGEMTTEDVAEGGENRYVHRLPLRSKFSNLSLKRGAVTSLSLLALWATRTLASGLAMPMVTQNLLVTLMNEKRLPTMAWAFFNAYPVKWDVSPLNSTENKIVTETLELSYGYFEQIPVGLVTG